jgi:serine/threonine protein kinase/tetratricopeptide (TPR) repeat protein
VLHAGDVVGDRFEIDRDAGGGAMGAVYHGRDRETGASVAVKLLRERRSEDLDERFAREAGILAEIRHEAVVRYIAHGALPGGERYLVMEWLEGEDLALRLARRGLTIAETLTLARRVAGALAELHARGVVHRDIKPANLFLEGGEVERVKVVDFGVVHARRSKDLTRTGDMIGTPAYMAPEQARGDRAVTPAVDVFALGCVLGECLLGRPLFAAGNVLAVMARVVFAEVPPLRESRPEIPRPLDELVLSMLAKDAGARPADGAALAAALDHLDLAAAEIEAAGAPARTAIGASERRLVSVVLASPSLARSQDAAARQTLKGPQLRAPSSAPSPTASTQVDLEDNLIVRLLWRAAEKHGARIEPLLDGSVAAMLTSTGWAGDLAVRAARCALAMRAALPTASMAAATVRAVVGARLPMGEAIDAAAALLRADRKPAEGGVLPVRLDDTTAGLLDARFEIVGDGMGLALRGERPLDDPARRLLGRATPFVGREREMAALLALHDECAGEPVARAVLLTGPAGVGKSRLRRELVDALRERGGPHEIWIGRGDPMSAGSPFGLLIQALRGAAALLEGEPASVRAAKLRARVARHVDAEALPRVLEFLAEMLAVDLAGEASVMLRVARADPVVMGDQIRRAFEDFVRAEAAAQPLVIVLEDLQWGDLPTVKLLDSALRHAADLPVLVVAVGRPEVRDLFPGLWAERGLQELRVGELGTRACERLVREVLGARADDELVARLTERAAGNAFYLEELIRAVAEGRSELPPTVLAMVQTRLEALPPDARRVLRAASLFGHAFWKGGVAALLGGDDLRGSLDVLVEKELVRTRGAPRFPGEDELVFRHTAVRDAAYAMLTENDRALGHRLAGEWLEKMGETDARALAEHFERGRDPERARRFYRRAAEHALEGNDLDAAIAHAERGVACGARGEELGALRLLQAEAHGWRGDYVARGQCSLEARNLLARGTTLWYVAAADLAVVSRVLGHRETLRGVCADLLGVTGEDPVARAIALVRASTQVAVMGEALDADRLIAAADEAALGDPAVEPWVHNSRAVRAALAGDPAICMEESKRSAEGFVLLGNLRCACTDWSNVGYSLAELGELEDAEEILRQMLLDAERMGIPMIVGGAKQNLALTLLRRGQAGAARGVAEEAIAIFSRQGDARSEGYARQYLARALAADGDLERAEVEARSAVELLASVPPSLPTALATLAHVHLALGNLASARHESRSAWEIAHRTGTLEEGECWVAAIHADVLAAAGELEAAHEAVAEARARLLARAEKIADVRMRRSFLERVPENAALLARARQWLG